MATVTLDDEKNSEHQQQQRYCLEASVLQDKALLIVQDRQNKQVYRTTFTSKELETCGFNNQHANNLQGVVKFIQAAQSGRNGAKFEIIGDTQPFETVVINILKEDPDGCFDAIKITMKLPLVPRRQSEKNYDHIQDLQERVTVLEQQLSAATEELKRHQMPTGSIIMWSGRVDDIPNGWRLCDGQHATPDLRNRFIVGAGQDYDVNASGGSKSHRHDIRVDGHSLSINEIPAHQHEFYQVVWVWDKDSAKNAWRICHKGEKILNRADSGNANHRTKPLGGGQAHSHSASSTDTEHLPLFYALCFIIKYI